ncbi:hypothetical protein L7F22_027567 [Adiantum nelumboides]|nr:hypothetical protein [Adiantum nelumboides]
MCSYNVLYSLCKASIVKRQFVGALHFEKDEECIGAIDVFTVLIFLSKGDSFEGLADSLAPGAQATIPNTKMLNLDYTCVSHMSDEEFLRLKKGIIIEQWIQKYRKEDHKLVDIFSNGYITELGLEQKRETICLVESGDEQRRMQSRLLEFVKHCDDIKQWARTPSKQPIQLNVEAEKAHIEGVSSSKASISIEEVEEFLNNEAIKKESEEYIEETQEDAGPSICHGATQITIGCSSQAIPLNKDEGHMKPHSKCRVPTPSSMPATTPAMDPLSTSSLVASTSSMAPSTLCMPTTTPHMAPASSSMVATTSSLLCTTSFVAQSSPGHEVWERRPITQFVEKESPEADVELPHMQVGGLIKDVEKARTQLLNAIVESTELQVEYPHGLASIIVFYIDLKEQLVDIPPEQAISKVILEVEISQFSSVVVEGKKFVFLHNIEKATKLQMDECLSLLKHGGSVRHPPLHQHFGYKSPLELFEKVISSEDVEMRNRTESNSTASSSSSPNNVCQRANSRVTCLQVRDPSLRGWSSGAMKSDNNSPKSEERDTQKIFVIKIVQGRLGKPFIKES